MCVCARGRERESNDVPSRSQGSALSSSGGISAISQAVPTFPSPPFAM